jgi:hypothetical protein
MANFKICTALFALALTVVGCQRANPSAGVEGAPSAAASAAGPTKEELEDSALGEKLGKSIECLNRASPNVFNSRKHYLSWIDEKKGITGKETSVLGIQEIHSKDQCVKALEEAKKLPPALPAIDSANAAYAASLTEVATLVKTANTYYAQGNYKDDHFAKAKEMHGPLVSAFDKFKAASEALDQAVTATNNQLAERNLRRIEKDPARRLEYLSRNAMQQAKLLIDFTNIKELSELNAEPYSAQLTSLEKATADLNQYADAHADEVHKVFTFSSFTGSLQKYLTSAKELQRRKRDNKDFAKERPPGGELFNLIPGHPAQIVEAYNKMIDDSNRLRFRG